MEGYARRVRRVLVAVLVLNLAVVLAKAVASWRSGSLSVLADTFHSLLDGGNNIVALLVLRAALAPPDEDHPWGHRKFETIAAFVLAGLLFVTAFEVLQSAFRRFVEPREVNVDAFTVGLLVASFAMNVAVTTWETREGRRLGSEILLADSAHTRADVLVTFGILLGLAGSYAGLAYTDPIAAVLVAGFIGYTGYQIFASTIPVLTDRAVFPPERIRAIVEAVPGVESVHDIRSRGRVEEPFVQMHLVVRPMGVVEAHAVTEAVERALERELGVKESVIHVEPEEGSR